MNSRYSDSHLGLIPILLCLLIEGSVFYHIFIYGITATTLALFGLTTLVFLNFFFVQVQVDDDYCTVKFGIGIIKKEFSLSAIRGFEITANNNFVSFLYNPFGTQALKVKLTSGEVIVIPSNEPKELSNQLKIRR